MQEESDLDFAIELSELVMEVLDKFKKENPVPQDLSKRKEYGKSADKYSHDFLMQAFAKYRPNDVVLSEEGLDPKERLSSQRCWIIDPLDGTFYFANNRRDYATHIALWEKESNDLSNISIAVVGIPETKKIYTSNDNLHIPVTNKVPRLLVSGSRPPLEMPKLIEFFDAKYGEWLGCHMIGAGVTDMIAEAVVAQVDVGDVWHVITQEVVRESCQLVEAEVHHLQEISILTLDRTLRDAGHLVAAQIEGDDW